MDAWSPAAGIRCTPNQWFSLFASAGTAFQVPTTTELAHPEGSGFNPALEPQTAVGYEAGARIEHSPALRAEIVGFFLRLEDELIPFESTSGRTAFRNAGRSRRYGLELDWESALPYALHWRGAVTLIDAEFREYTTGAGTFAGFDEPGIPSWQIFQEVAYRHPLGFFVALEALFVDGFPVDDANTARSRGYQVLNLRTSYDLERSRWRLTPFVGVGNLSGTAYDGTVRLNAANGAYFEPAPEVNFYAGLAVRAVL
jgi:iron complex outermembrane receptor protein